MNKRIAEWDFIKGFLIIMVMLGHATASLGDYYKPRCWSIFPA